MKTAVISGAAGGLGMALVDGFCNAGFNILAIDIDEGRLKKLEGRIRVKTLPLDVSDPGQLKRLSGIIENDNLDVAVLVCAAGIYGSFPVTESDPLEFRKIMDVNLFGASHLIHALLTPLIRNKGRVIVISSESHKIQAMFQPYMISKASLEAYCRVARQELALKDISLIVIRPGAINTPLLDWMKKSPVEIKYPVFGNELAKSLQRSIKMVGKIASVEKVARLVLKAALSRTPRRIYRVNNSNLLKIVAMIPGSLFDRILVRLFRER